MMRFFDAHTHAHFAAFENDWKEVIDRALAASVWLINIGTQKDTSRRAVEAAHEYAEGVYAAVGLHPIHAEKSYHDAQELGFSSFTPFSNSRELENGKEPQGFVSRGENFDLDYYRELAADPKVVAIGECGLDYYRLEEKNGEKSFGAAQDRQKEAFEAQIKLSGEIKKPLMIHCRGSRSSPQGNAFGDLIKILNSKSRILNSPPGVIHFFSGTGDDAKALLDLGFSFTFGGVITFARDYDEVIKMIPFDRILSETDAPYVAPVPYRGKRNEPAYVVEIVKKLAEIKNVSVEKMKMQIWENARRIFKISQ